MTLDDLFSLPVLLAAAAYLVLGGVMVYGYWRAYRNDPYAVSAFKKVTSA